MEIQTFIKTYGNLVFQIKTDRATFTTAQLLFTESLNNLVSGKFLLGSALDSALEAGKVFEGKAKCCPEDKFDGKIGNSLAIRRSLDKVNLFLEKVKKDVGKEQVLIDKVGVPDKIYRLTEQFVIVKRVL